MGTEIIDKTEPIKIPAAESPTMAAAVYRAVSVVRISVLSICDGYCTQQTSQNSGE